MFFSLNTTHITQLTKTYICTSWIVLSVEILSAGTCIVDTRTTDRITLISIYLDTNINEGMHLDKLVMWLDTGWTGV
jgi:hypothetical protein